MFRHYRFRFVIDRGGFSVAFTQSDTYTDKGIQLPVTVTGLLGVELIRQGVGIRFDVNRQAVIQTKVATKTETSGNEKLTFLPEIFHLISTSIERICFVIVKTTVQPCSGKKIAIEHTLRIETTEQSTEIRHDVYISLQIFILVGLLRIHPSPLCLPATYTNTCTECGSKLITDIKSCCRRNKISEFCFTYGMGCSYLCLNEPMRFERNLFRFLDTLFLGGNWQYTDSHYTYQQFSSNAHN